MPKLFENKIFRVGESDFGKNEILLANQTHTDKRLKAIAEGGFNGIWLRGKLRELTPTDLFKPYISKTDESLKELIKLCKRADRFGLGIWLYMQEPLALPQSHRFWKDHPDLAGSPVRILDDPLEFSMCTSTNEVKNFLRNGFKELFSKAPLAGVILITASEFPSHCWGRIMPNTKNKNFDNSSNFPFECPCPRCNDRGPVETVSEIISLIHQGIKSSRPQAKVVAWDWSWNMYLQPPYRKLIDALPKDIILMGDFERGGTVQRGGKKTNVEEYSLIYPGPSKRFRDKARLAKNKKPLWAKLQINTTHELATVPNLPLVVSLYRKFKFLRQAKAAGFMASWNFALSTDTLNVFAVNMFTSSKFNNDEKKCLISLAKAYFGTNVDAEAVVKAWYAFFRAGRHYPLQSENGFLYYSPVNYSLSYPLKLEFGDKPMGPAWLKHKFGDCLDNTTGQYSLSEITDFLARFSSAWAKAVVLYETALAPAIQHKQSKKELAVAKVAGAAFRSSHNIYQWYLLRRNKKTKTLGTKERSIIADELENLQTALPLVEADRRIGFHQEAQWYMFDAEGIKRKISQLKKM